MDKSDRFEVDEYQVEKVNGITTEYPYTMHLRNLTDFTVPWHWHEEVELGYIESGMSIIRTLSAEYKIPAGSGFFINTNVMDMKENGSPGRRTQEVCHIFHPVYLSGHFQSRFETKYMNPILKNRSLDVHIIQPDHKTGRQILQNLKEVRELQRSENTEFQTRNVLSETWLLLIKEIKTNFSRSSHVISESEERLRSMLSYMHHHYAEKLSLKDIAASTNISEREALRCFQNKLHKTPFEYLTEFRLENARRLLTETDAPVTEIGYRTGFADSAYFSKVFKKYSGVTPSEYRRQHSVSL